MKIKCHKRVGANLHLFLTYLGFKCVWNRLNSDSDELCILDPKAKIKKFLEAIKKEVEHTGHVPYHYCLKFPNKTKAKVTEDKVEFTGKIVDVKTIPNVAGGFHLIAFAGDDKLNYLWKCYDLSKKFESSKSTIKVNARMKATLVTSNKSVINLINYTKMRDV